MSVGSHAVWVKGVGKSLRQAELSARASNPASDWPVSKFICFSTL